jgi:nitroreductase
MNIRSFTDHALCPEAVRKLLQAAMAAPSAGDQRPWHFVVVEDAATRERMANSHPLAHLVPQAPVAIVVCGDLTLQKHPGFWMQDCAAATANLLIEARALGLGAMWLRISPNEGRVQNFRKLLDLPAHLVPFALIPVGHSGECNELKCVYDESRVHFERW